MSELEQSSLLTAPVVGDVQGDASQNASVTPAVPDAPTPTQTNDQMVPLTEVQKQINQLRAAEQRQRAMEAQQYNTRLQQMEQELAAARKAQELVEQQQQALQEWELKAKGGSEADFAKLRVEFERQKLAKEREAIAQERQRVLQEQQDYQTQIGIRAKLARCVQMAREAGLDPKTMDWSTEEAWTQDYHNKTRAMIAELQKRNQPAPQVPQVSSAIPSTVSQSPRMRQVADLARRTATDPGRPATLEEATALYLQELDNK